jgi:hypothetical protein
MLVLLLMLVRAVRIPGSHHVPPRTCAGVPTNSAFGRRSSCQEHLVLSAGVCQVDARKGVDPLAPLDWTGQDLDDFAKDFYTEQPMIAAMTQQQVGKEGLHWGPQDVWYVPYSQFMQHPAQHHSSWTVYTDLLAGCYVHFMLPATQPTGCMEPSGAAWDVCHSVIRCVEAQA